MKRNRKKNNLKTVKVTNNNTIKKAPKIPFEVWWSRYKTIHNYDDTLKEAIYRHFKSRGILETCNWETGIKDFGLK